MLLDESLNHGTKPIERLNTLTGGLMQPYCGIGLFWLLIGSVMPMNVPAHAVSLADLVSSRGTVVGSDGHFDGFTATVTTSSLQPTGCCVISDLNAINVLSTTIPGGPALTITGPEVSGHIQEPNAPPSITAQLSVGYDVHIQDSLFPGAPLFHFFILQGFGTGNVVPNSSAIQTGSTMFSVEALDRQQHSLGFLQGSSVGLIPARVIAASLAGTESMLHVKEVISINADRACTASGDCSYGFGGTTTAFFGVIATVPEPGSLLLMVSGLGFTAIRSSVRRRRRRS